MCVNKVYGILSINIINIRQHHDPTKREVYNKYNSTQNNMYIMRIFYSKGLT